MKTVTKDPHYYRDKMREHRKQLPTTEPRLQTGKELRSWLERQINLTRKAQGLDGGKAPNDAYWTAYFAGQERLCEVVLNQIGWGARFYRSRLPKVSTDSSEPKK